MTKLNNNGRVSYGPMKDYEKRQYGKNGKYKGSIHDKSKNAKKHVSWATVIFWGIVIVFVLMALADN